jgi:N-dimethylarginine dimethylaminohydrolase
LEINIPYTARKAEVLALAYPTETDLLQEYAGYIATHEKQGAEVLFADPEAAYSFDYTCPRDIGFVIGDTFFIANMAVQSRTDEIETIKQHLQHIAPTKSCAHLPAACSNA